MQSSKKFKNYVSQKIAYANGGRMYLFRGIISTNMTERVDLCIVSEFRTNGGELAGQPRNKERQDGEQQIESTINTNREHQQAEESM